MLQHRSILPAENPLWRPGQPHVIVGIFGLVLGLSLGSYYHFSMDFLDRIANEPQFSFTRVRWPNTNEQQVCFRTTAMAIGPSYSVADYEVAD